MMKNKMTKGGFIAIIILLVFGAALLGADLLAHRHGEIAAEDILFFPAFFGFLAFIVFVIGGVILRFIIARGEDYYDN